MKNFFLCLIILLAGILRLYRLDSNPPSLYWDEASLGYNAYSILASGKDEHGERFPLARFIAFGDYKPPGYIYSAAASIGIFGINEFGVRFPSSLAGILMTIFTYLLLKKIFKSNKLSLLASFLFALSPWSIHLSRVAFEANLAAFFNLAGIYFFIKGKKSGLYILFSALFFLFSFYTFNANRIIAPLIYLMLSLIFFRSTIVNIKWHTLSIMVCLILLIPSIDFLKSQNSKLRFQEVSIFNNLSPIILSNQRMAVDGNSFLSGLIHNRRFLYFKDYLKHFSDNFSGRFLFTHGDVNPRLSVQGMGQLYFLDLPFFVVGLIYLIFKRDKITFLIFFWMLLSVTAAGTARETPHALRIASILPAYQIIIAIGLYQFVLWIKKIFSKNIYYSVTLVSCILYLFNFLYYLHLYHIHFPSNWSGEFQYGTREMVSYVNSIKPNYDRIFVSPEIGRPYIFFAFYTPILPAEFQKNSVALKDGFGFWNVSSVGNIDFNLQGLNNFSEKSLLVTTKNNLPAPYRLIKIINNLGGNPVFYIADNL